MRDFAYVAAESVSEVVSLLSKNDQQARILSGGTDLIVQMREGRKTADLVIDIKHIPDLNALAFNSEQGLTLGASVPCYQIASDPIIQKTYPGLVDAISLIGGAQIQGRASVGGNLCNASPAADSIPALIVHKAMCVIAGINGMRELPVEQFCTGPGKTALDAGEFLVALRIPPPVKGFGARYLRFIPRNEMDIAVVGAGAAVVLSDDRQRIVSALVALGAVAPTPLLVSEAGAFLAGKEVSPENIFEAARIAQAAARPIRDMRGTVEQRKHLSLILARRAITGAVERAREGSLAGGNGHAN